MIAKAIDKICELQKKRTEVLNVDGRNYATNDNLTLIEEPTYKPGLLELSSLESIVTLVQTEALKYTDKTIYVHVENHRKVVVFTTFDEKNRRDFLYSASADVVNTPIDRWTDKDDLLIALNSVFIPGEDVDYIQKVLNKLTEESKVSSTDNGLGQSIEVQKGISLKENMTLKPRVQLRPYRTFLEVEQPESEFILRARDGGAFLIKSADGERWKLDAKRNIKAYLMEYIGDIKNVVVMA